MARLTTPILLLFTLLLLLTTTQAESEGQWQAYRGHCHSKNAAIISAIDRLCSKPDLSIPGVRTRLGEGFDRVNKVLMLPNPFCLRDGRMQWDKPVWVPKYWCERQFWKTCSQGNGKGRGKQTFGQRGCQDFYITDH